MILAFRARARSLTDPVAGILQLWDQSAMTFGYSFQNVVTMRLGSFLSKNKEPSSKNQGAHSRLHAFTRTNISYI